MFKFTEPEGLHNEFKALINDQDQHAPIEQIDAWRDYLEQAASGNVSLSPIVADELIQSLENENIPEKGWTRDLINLTLVYLKLVYANNEIENESDRFGRFYVDKIKDDQLEPGLLRTMSALLQTSEKRKTGPAAFYAIMQGRRLAKMISSHEESNHDPVLKAYCAYLNRELPCGDQSDDAAQNRCWRYLQQIKDSRNWNLRPAGQRLSLLERSRVTLGGSPAGVAPRQWLIMALGAFSIAATVAMFSFNQDTRREFQAFHGKFIAPYEQALGVRIDD